MDEEDYNDQFGSAEQDSAYGTSNNVLDRFREGKKNRNKTWSSPKGTAASTQKDNNAHSGSTALFVLHILSIVIIFPEI